MTITEDTPPAETSAGPLFAGRRVQVVLAGAVCVLVLSAVGSLAFRDAEDSSPAGTSTSAGSFALPALRGEGTVRLEQFRGKPVVVNLFASWCDVCDLELPAYTKLSKELEGKIAFVGVDSMETGDPQPMIDRHHIDAWPLARDSGPNGRGLHDALAPGFGGMPITAFYDADGKLLKVHRGGLLEDDLRATLSAVYSAR